MSRLLQATIPRRQRHCVGCQKPFVDKQEYHSTLGDEENGQFLRRDFCRACYQNEVAAEKPAVTWKGIVASSAVKKDPSTDHITRLLEQLKETQGKPGQATEAFFLALYLARKKAIIFRHEILNTDGRALWIYEVMATEEMLTVEKVPITKLQGAHLQKEVLDLLQKK